MNELVVLAVVMVVDSASLVMSYKANAVILLSSKW